MENKNYHTVRTIPKLSHCQNYSKIITVRTIPNYHTVRTIPTLSHCQNYSKIITLSELFQNQMLKS